MINPPEDSKRPSSPETPKSDIPDLQIDTSAGRRWGGRIAYVLFFLLVAALLVLVLSRFSGSVALAVGLVAFMVGYMLLMGHAASGDIDERN